MKHSWVKRKERKKRLCRRARASISMWPRDDRAQQLSSTGEVAGPPPMPASSLSALIKTMGPGRRWSFRVDPLFLLNACICTLARSFCVNVGHPARVNRAGVSLKQTGLTETQVPTAKELDGASPSRDGWMSSATFHESHAGPSLVLCESPNAPGCEALAVSRYDRKGLEVPAIDNNRHTHTHTIELGEATALPVP